MTLPIIFIHRGYSSYLEFSLRQAKFSSPSSEVILLGDDANECLGKIVKHVNIKDFSKAAIGFSKIYQHYSTNPYDYELFCFQRWFILLEYMISENINEVFVCDSDVLIYSDINNLHEELFLKYDLALAIYGNGPVSAGISYWKISPIKLFCELLRSSYTDNEKLKKIRQIWDTNRAEKALGGFSDMGVVADFCQEHKNKKTYNLLEINQKSTFDSQINLRTDVYGGVYNFKFGKKIFKWGNDIPYCYNNSRGDYIKFNLIHFQGPAKYMMAAYYTGPDFNRKLLLTVKFRFLDILAFWYKILKIRYRFAFIFNIIFRLKRN